jgi:tetratricopeptide (TPR) repeat protein
VLTIPGKGCKTDKLQEALGVCDAASHRNPNNPDTNFLKGLIYHKCNNLYEAERFLKQSLTLYEQEFSKTSYEQEFSKSRTEYFQQMIQYVKQEYREVCRKLDNQSPRLWGGY